MTTKATFARMILVLVATCCIADASIAKTVPIKGHNPDQVASSCNGAHFPPNQNGVWGCMNKDGSGIVCGGSGKNAKTCDTFKQSPHDHRLPTRAEAVQLSR
jgi:hypothetical protein